MGKTSGTDTAGKKGKRKKKQPQKKKRVMDGGRSANRLDRDIDTKVILVREYWLRPLSFFLTGVFAMGPRPVHPGNGESGHG